MGMTLPTAQSKQDDEEPQDKEDSLRVPGSKQELLSVQGTKHISKVLSVARFNGHCDSEASDSSWKSELNRERER